MCGLVVVIVISATALAVGLSTGPVPAPKPLAEAVHDSLTGAAGQPIQGVSARVQLTDHLLEGANLASGGGGGGAGQLASSPLVTGAAGRLWISSDGRVRLELQSDKGDTQILYDGTTVTMYDAASNAIYRYTPPQGSGSSAADSSSSDSGGASSSTANHHVPTVQEIQEAITHVMGHANLSGATPTDVAGQPAYTVRISPSRNGGLVGGAELSWDAVHGVPLRLAVYSSTSSTPVIELAATEISYGAVGDSTFQFTPPSGATITEVAPPGQSGSSAGSAPGGSSTGADQHSHVSGLSAVQAAVPFTLDAPASLAGMARGDVQLVSSGKHPAALITYGEGLAGVAVLESQAKGGAGSTSPNPGATTEESSSPAGLPQVKLSGATANELPTPLGTLLQFERAGVSYVIAGSVTPATAEAAAKGL
jgi:outer membrane lipoprotein-sorting protein